MPARCQLNCLSLDVAARVSPADINLRHQPPTIRQSGSDSCAHGAAARQIQSLDAATHSCRCCQILIKWQAEAYSKEGALGRTLIEVKERGGPLIGHGII